MKVKNKIRSPIILILMSILFIGLAYAQFQENWIYTYNGTADSTDVAKVMAGHNSYLFYSGSIYVGGYTIGIGTGKDFLVKKFAETLIPGYETFVKEPVWTYTWNGSANKDDEVNAIYVEGGNLFIAGYTTKSNNTRDLRVVCLDTIAGAMNWEYTYNGPGNGNDEAYAIAGGYGLQGGNDYNIYVAGYSAGIGTGLDFTVIKFDPLLTGGTHKWVYRKTGPGNNSDIAYSIATTSSAASGTQPMIYAAGYTTGSGSGKDFTIIKLDTLGTEKWVLPHDVGDNDIAKVIRMARYSTPENSKPFIIVAGQTGNTGNTDFAIARVDSSGYMRWVRSYNGSGNGNDACNSLCAARTQVSYDTSMFAVGYTTGIGTGKDYTVMKVNLNNDSLVGPVYIYNGEGNGDDEALASDCNPLGAPPEYIYVTGYTTGIGTGKEIIETKHGYKKGTSGLSSWDGTARHIYRYDSPNHLDDVGNAIIAHSYNNQDAAVAGYCGINKSDFTVLSIPNVLPPTIPILIAPKDSSWLNDTILTFRWHKSISSESGMSSPKYMLWYMWKEWVPPETLLRVDPPIHFIDSMIVIVEDTIKTLILTDAMYSWKVKAFYGTYYSRWSDTWNLGFDITPPDVPILYSPVNDTLICATISPIDVAFDWGSVTFRDVPTLIRYILRIDTLPLFSSPIFQDTFLETNAVVSHPEGNHYYWQVEAYDLAGNESYSDVESYRLDVDPPIIDSTTRWQNTPLIGPFYVYSKVKDMFGIDSVKLYYDFMETPAFFPCVMTVGTVDWYHADIPKVKLENDTVKYFIRAKDKVGHVSQDPATGYYWFIANCDTGGIQDFTVSPMTFSFDLESNPVKGMALFNLALPQDALITLKIYDISGRIVNKVSDHKSAGYYQIPWTVKNAGVYFYTFESSGHKETGKLVIVH